MLCILVASGPAYQFLYAQQDRITHHVRRYTRPEITAKAERAGFEIVKASYINFILFPLILPAVLAIKAWQALTQPSDEGAGSNVARHTLNQVSCRTSSTSCAESLRER